MYDEGAIAPFFSTQDRDTVLTFTEFFSSITNNVNARMSHPVVGAFSISWLFVNWDKVVLLLFGTGTVDERVKAFKESEPVWKLIESTEPLSLVIPWEWLWCFVALPGLMTLAFLLVLPVMSHNIERKQNAIEKKRYADSVAHKVHIQEKRQDLVKAIAKADRHEEVAQKELDSIIMEMNRQEELKRAEAEAQKVLSEHKAEESKKLAAEAAADTARAEADTEIEVNKKLQLELENLAIAEDIKKSGTNDKQAFNDFVQTLATEFAIKDKDLSLSDLGAFLANLFGFSTAKELVNRSLGFSKVKFIYVPDAESKSLFFGLLKNKDDEKIRMIIERAIEKSLNFMLVSENFFQSSFDKILLEMIKSRRDEEIDKSVDEVIQSIEKLSWDSQRFERNKDEFRLFYYGHAPGASSFSHQIIVRFPVVFGSRGLANFTYEVNEVEEIYSA